MFQEINPLYLSIAIVAVFFIATFTCAAIVLWQQRFRGKEQENLKLDIIERFGSLTQTLDRRLSENLLQQSKETHLLQHQINEYLAKQSEHTSLSLKDISLQVDKRLNDGFEKTTETFVDIVKRLALIDDAQKKLTELSSNVVSLQEILVDKRARGAFGEVQLQNLVQNILAPMHYAFQHTLSNHCRVDCMLFLPGPCGNIAIDSKFPLENYQMMTKFTNSDLDRKKSEQLFKQDIKKHITDIRTKYILPGETTEGAILFIPAEVIFAEIHAQFPDLVEMAQKAQVWLASPTTLMAILTTVRTILKDNATREHIHVIQAHLRILSSDFNRFDNRLDNLAKHLDQVNKDVEQIRTSAKKIFQRFQLVEKGEVITETEVEPVI